jgi:hypothetical protein
VLIVVNRPGCVGFVLGEKAVAITPSGQLELATGPIGVLAGAARAVTIWLLEHYIH